MWVYVACFVGCFLFEFVCRFQSARRKYSLKYEVVEVRVSRQNEAGPIVAESVFAALHGIKRRFSADSVSFEIVSMSSLIKFYVAFPPHLENLVLSQIYAQYPDVEIERCDDYAFHSNSSENALATELMLCESDIFPIKRYTQFEDRLARIAVDPLSAITSLMACSKDLDDQLFLQLIVSPLPERWSQSFSNCVRILRKGAFLNIKMARKIYVKCFVSRKFWLKILFFPLYLIFWIQSFLLNANDDEIVSRLHDRESEMDAASDKVSRLLYDVALRIIYLPKSTDEVKSKDRLMEVAACFKQFSLPNINGFKTGEFYGGKRALNLYRKRIIRKPILLNNEELATIWHLPNVSVQTPSIDWVQSRKLPPPLNLPLLNQENVTLLGQTNFRAQKKVFGILGVDRRRHVYVVGKTGMGKSTLLENMIYSDIHAGRGVAVIDPHGDLADATLAFIPSSRINDVVLIDPADQDYAVGLNMFDSADPASVSIVCSGIIGIFKKIYADSWGPRLEHILRNTVLALLENEGTTMLGIMRILQDEKYRQQIVRRLDDPVVKDFWLKEFDGMQDKFRSEAISPIQNKVGQFLSSAVVRNIVGQMKSTVDLRFCMDKGKIVIINLSKGKIGEDNSALLGAMFITKFQLDAMSRADLPLEKRRDFYLYVDEFQNFATDAFSTILSEARKYALNLTMANQYIAQMPEEVRDSVFGNVGTLMSFQVGADDAEYLCRQFAEQVLPEDLVSLEKYKAYMKLLIDGSASRAFSLDTLGPPGLMQDREIASKIVKVSRERYSQKTSEIQKKILKWSST